MNRPRATVLCLCHDVTRDDVDRAVAEGFRDPETIKRFTGALMGPCQGAWCADLFLEAIADSTGIPRISLRPPRARPPAIPVRLGQLAGPESDGRP